MTALLHVLACAFLSLVGFGFACSVRLAYEEHKRRQRPPRTDA